MGEVGGGVAQRRPDLRDGDGSQSGRPGGPPGQVGQDRGEGVGLGGGGRDALGADEGREQDQPPPEDHPGPVGALGVGEGVPALAEGSGVEGVDPGGHPDAEGEGLHADGPAELFVLVLDVAGDEGAHAEVHEPEQDRLDGGGLAGAGLAEEDQVGVGDDLGQHPPDRVDAEPGPGRGGDAEGGAGRGQRVAAEQGEDPADLGGRGPVGDQRVRHRRPPAVGPGQAARRRARAHQAGLGMPGRAWGRRGGRLGQVERVERADVGQRPPVLRPVAPLPAHDRSKVVRRPSVPHSHRTCHTWLDQDPSHASDASSSLWPAQTSAEDEPDVG